MSEKATGKVAEEALARRVVEIAESLAAKMPDTPAANRLRVWIGDGDGTPPAMEGPRSAWERRCMADVALGHERSWWLRMESTKGGGNGAALGDFSKECMALWRSAPSPAAGKKLIEMCADAAWRACAARFYARMEGVSGEALLDRSVGLALEKESAFEPRMSLLGLKKTLAAALAAPWMADPAALGLSAGAAKEQGDAYRDAIACGLSGAYRAAAGLQGEPCENPLAAWREEGFSCAGAKLEQRRHAGAGFQQAARAPKA